MRAYCVCRFSRKVAWIEHRTINGNFGWKPEWNPIFDCIIFVSFIFGDCDFDLGFHCIATWITKDPNLTVFFLCVGIAMHSFGFALISDCYNVSRNSRRSNSIIAIIVLFHCHRACMCNHSASKISLRHIVTFGFYLPDLSLSHTHTLTRSFALSSTDCGKVNAKFKWKRKSFTAISFT